MNEDQTYTLAELADKCGLTERTARYYIENVLPSHHKKGRGKLAQYGQDTYNCFQFIQQAKKRYGFRPGQIQGVLASIGQETIDRTTTSLPATRSALLFVVEIPSSASNSSR